jgi:hypothetical protein
MYVRSLHQEERYLNTYCQSGQNHIAGPHPNPLARTDIPGYRELYAALNLLSPV